MSRALCLAAAVCTALLAAGCGPEAPSPLDGPDGTAQQALDACFLGDVPGGLALVARRAARDDVDALTARALCRWMAFAADSSRADAEGALGDLDLAIRLAAEQPHETPLDHLYAHRAFARQAVAPGDWAATLDDLDAAIRLAPGSARHLLDRAFVRLAQADTAGAVADLERVLLVDAKDTARLALATRTLDELADDLAFRDQETVVFE